MLVQVAERDTTVVKGIGKPGVERNGPIVTFDRLVRLLQVAQGVAAVHMGRGIARIELEGLVEAVDCSALPAEDMQCVAEVVVGRGIVRIDCNGPADQVGRTCEVIGLRGNYAQGMQGVGMAGLYLEDLPIDLICLGQLPLLMQGDAVFEVCLHLRCRGLLGAGIHISHALMAFFGCGEILRKFKLKFHAG
ncbi:MAG: hypothetical protein NT115_13100 [Proteobacteria bacterium]|nr:hypothetical protein [Pseudomonadota bacterium]